MMTSKVSKDKEVMQINIKKLSHTMALKKDISNIKLVKNLLLPSSKTSIVFATLQLEGGERPHDEMK